MLIMGLTWCYYNQVSYTGSWEPLVEMHDRPWCLDTVHVSFQRKTAHFNPFTINKGQSLRHCRPLLQKKNLGRGSPFNVSYQNCCIGGVTIFISLYWRSDNFYFIVLEEGPFLLYNELKIVTPPIQWNKNCHSSNTIKWKCSLLQYNWIKTVTPPIQLNKNCQSSNTIKKKWSLLIVLEEWQFLFNCFRGVTIFI
jgi:hypothetical protein